MIGRQLTRWTLVLGVTACTADANRPPGTSPSDSRGPGGPTTTAAVTSTTAGTGGSGGGDRTDSGSTGGSSDASSSNGGASSADAAPADASRKIPEGGWPVIHDDAPVGPIACAGNRATLGSNRLLAGGSTPASFAEAYNAELAKLPGPGPLLIVLSGVDDANPAGWIASFGALDATRASDGVRFAGAHADVSFVMGDARSVQIAPTIASFELKFIPPANDTRVPVGSIELSGALSIGCGSLVITRAKMLVPATMGALAFHGSTIASLMGPATDAFRGQPASAWPLELAGTAKQVYAPGVLDEGDAGR